jgi:NHL repeat-containing protein
MFKIGNAVCGVGRFGGCYSTQSLPTGYTGDGAPATAANLGGPSDVAVDAAGNLYVAVPDYNRVRKITLDGIISTIAGTGTAGCGGDGGQATSALLNYPEGVAVDNSGNVFIADSRNQRVRKIDANGVISTVAGNGPNATNPFSQPPSCPGTLTPIDICSLRIETARTSGKSRCNTRGQHRRRYLFRRARF